MEEIEIGSGGQHHGGGGGLGGGYGGSSASGTGLATSVSELEVLNVNAGMFYSQDGDDTINAVFARIDSDYWDSEDDLIISPVFKGTDTLAYIDDLESGEVPILYQKFWDPYEDVTVTLFSITPRLTHAAVGEADSGLMSETEFGMMTDKINQALDNLDSIDIGTLPSNFTNQVAQMDAEWDWDMANIQSYDVSWTQTNYAQSWNQNYAQTQNYTQTQNYAQNYASYQAYQQQAIKKQ